MHYKRSIVRDLCAAGIAAVCVAIVGQLAQSTSAAEPPLPRTVERIPVTMLKLAAGETVRLEAREGRRIKNVAGFETAVLTVVPTSPTSLQLTGVKAGVTELAITYDGQTNAETLVIIAR